VDDGDDETCTVRVTITRDGEEVLSEEVTLAPEGEDGDGRRFDRSCPPGARGSSSR
jgi:hypothetical protein